MPDPDPRDRFTGLAGVYQRARPSYPAPLVDWILACAPAGRIADIGCGTGIATRLFSNGRTQARRSASAFSIHFHV